MSVQCFNTDSDPLAQYTLEASPRYPLGGHAHTTKFNIPSEEDDAEQSTYRVCVVFTGTPLTLPNGTAASPDGSRNAHYTS